MMRVVARSSTITATATTARAGRKTSEKAKRATGGRVSSTACAALSARMRSRAPVAMDQIPTTAPAESRPSSGTAAAPPAPGAPRSRWSAAVIRGTEPSTPLRLASRDFCAAPVFRPRPRRAER